MYPIGSLSEAFADPQSYDCPARVLSDAGICDEAIRTIQFAALANLIMGGLPTIDASDRFA
jgi:hypothetical protein